MGFFYLSVNGIFTQPRDFSSYCGSRMMKPAPTQACWKTVIGSCVFYTDSGNRIYLYSEYSMVMKPTMDCATGHNAELLFESRCFEIKGKQDLPQRFIFCYTGNGNEIFARVDVIRISALTSWQGIPKIYGSYSSARYDRIRGGL